MTDLEDRILKKNIPGKYSWWDEYIEPERVEEDEGAAVEDHEDCPPPTTAPTMMAPTTGKAGPKGVLADYKLHQEERKRQTLIDQLEKEELRQRNTQGVKMKPGEVSIALADIRRRHQEERRKQREADDRESESDDDEDDKFMERYRQQRLMELQKSLAPPMFEGVEDVDPLGYSERVDGTDPRVMVVVHLYETYIPACRTLSPILETISRDSMQHVRFLSLKAAKASDTLDPVALPSVLIHKGGHLIANLTPITNHLPDTFTPEDVEELLRETCGLKKDKVQLPPPQAAREEVAYDSDAELDEFCEGFDGVL